MAEIKIYYSSKTFDNMMNNVKTSQIYNEEEVNTLLKMITQMKEQDFLLYMVEIYKEDLFDFHIEEFDKYKSYLIDEVYNELIQQLLDKYKDYEDVSYSDIRKWFDGMTFDIELINILDQRFKEANIKILYFLLFCPSSLVNNSKSIIKYEITMNKEDNSP